MIKNFKLFCILIGLSTSFGAEASSSTDSLNKANATAARYQNAFFAMGASLGYGLCSAPMITPACANVKSGEYCLIIASQHQDKFDNLVDLYGSNPFRLDGVCTVIRLVPIPSAD